MFRVLQSIVLILLLTCCNLSLSLTAQNIKDAEHMCERQKGVAWMQRNYRWLEVRCVNGMIFKKNLHQKKDLSTGGR